MDHKQFIIEVTDSTFNDAADEMTSQIRLKALERAWPMMAAKSLHVVYVPEIDKFDVIFNTGYKRVVEDLEFGTQDTPPSPVIRPFMNSMGNMFSDNFEESYQETLLDNVNLAD